METKHQNNVALLEEAQNMMHIFSNYQPEEMKMVFAKLAALKEALKAADMFYEASVKFAQLEAYALIRAVELSNGERPTLTGANKTVRSEAAVWLFNMTENERVAIIEKCKEGKTLIAIYKELTGPNDKERASAIRMQLGRNIAFDLKQKGVAVINTEENKRLIRSLPSNLQQDVTDGLRNLLLRKGAVGIGDHEGTYIVPESNDKEVIKALETRLNSMQKDFFNFLSVARKCTNKPCFDLCLPKKAPILSIHGLLLVLAAYEDAIDLYMNDTAQEVLKEKFLSIEKTLSLKNADLLRGVFEA